MTRPVDIWERVDKSGDCWTWTGAITADGYGRFGTVAAHRAVYERVNGPVPPGMMLDHMCHNRACVRPDHLRAVTNKQNSENLYGPKSNSRSGVRGVVWAEHVQKWRVRVQHNYKTVEGGYFTRLDEAEAAAKDLRNQLFTHNDRDRTEKAGLKPGDRVVYLGGGNAYLGRVTQPIYYCGVRRWAIEWEDELRDGTSTYPEESLVKVVPQ